MADYTQVNFFGHNGNPLVPQDPIAPLRTQRLDDELAAIAASISSKNSRRTMGMTFDGGGAVPTAGSVGYIVAQFAGIIDRWDIIADSVGSAVVDIWKSTGAIPTDANRIAGTEKLTLSGAQLASDTSLTTWTTLAVAVGDVIGFELESASGCTRVTAQIRITEST